MLWKMARQTLIAAVAIALLAGAWQAATGPAHDHPQRGVGLPGRGVYPDPLALHQTVLVDQRQHPAEHLFVNLTAGGFASFTARNDPAPGRSSAGAKKSRSESESAQRHSIPRSESMPSK